jgi:hypothetical protein
MRVGDAIATITVALGVVALPAAEPAVGSVKAVRGNCVVQRGAESIPAREGLPLHAKDVVRTAEDGHAGIILNDGTRIAVGPRSEVAIDEFTFEPGKGQLSLVLRMLRGAMVYVSGKIAEMSPQSVKVETPVGVLGLRGTRVAITLEEP